MNTKYSKKSLIIIIFVLAFVLRSGYSLYAYKNNFMENLGDDWGRWQYALNVIAQGPFVTQVEHFYKPEATRGPVLPWIMSILILFFGENWLPIFFLNAFIGSLTCILIFLICEQHIKNRILGLFAGLWAAFHVSFIRYTATAGNEVWVPFFIVLMVFILLSLKKLKSWDKSLYKNLFLLSLIFALLIHTDERYLSYLPFVFMVILFWDHRNLINGIKKGMLFVFVVLILMVPWIIRNYVVFDNLVILTTRTASLTSKFINYNDDLVFKHTSDCFHLSETQIDSVISGLKTKFDDGDDIDPLQIEAMKNGHIPHLFSTSEAFWSRFKLLWQPIHLKGFYRITGFNYEGKWSLRHNLAVGLSYGLLIPFLFIGLVKLYHQKKKIAIFLFSILLYHSTIHVLFVPYTRDRYRIPVDAIVIILGVYGILTSYRYIKKRVSHRNVDDTSLFPKKNDMPSIPS